MNKHALIETLHDWINQRPGLEPANYMRGWDDTAGRSAYRSDARSITKDLHDARYLLDYIAIRDSITAERILEAAKHSFSGRLSITPKNDGFKVDYCIGQYWSMEYRKATAAVLWCHMGLAARRKAEHGRRRHDTQSRPPRVSREHSPPLV
jgi:hypothetical protein